MLAASFLYFVALRDSGRGKEIRVPTAEELMVFVLAGLSGLAGLIGLLSEGFWLILVQFRSGLKRHEKHLH